MNAQTGENSLRLEWRDSLEVSARAQMTFGFILLGGAMASGLAAIVTLSVGALKWRMMAPWDVLLLAFATLVLACSSGYLFRIGVRFIRKRDRASVSGRTYHLKFDRYLAAHIAAALIGVILASVYLTGVARIVSVAIFTGSLLPAGMFQRTDAQAGTAIKSARPSTRLIRGRRG